MKFKIIARAGCSELLVVFEEKEVIRMEANNPEEVAQKLGGRYLKIENEDCVLLQKIPQILEQNQIFLKWWERADIIKINKEKGKLFIIK